jgi:hypothetical protein
MMVSNELIVQQLVGRRIEEPPDRYGLLRQLAKHLIERALEANMTEHLGHKMNSSVANAYELSPHRQDFYTPSKVTLADHLHDQLHRVGNHVNAEDDQEPDIIS